MTSGILRASIIAVAALCAGCTTASSSHPDGYVWIAPGTYEMGSRIAPQEIQDQYGFEFTAGAVDGWQDQLPLHEVAIEHGFWLAAHEITVAEFQIFVDATGYVTDAESQGWGFGWADGSFSEVQGVSWHAPGWEQAPQEPVTLVSWRDVAAYLTWRNETQSDVIYRLPTEAEWEFAARAGTDTNYYWGDDNEGAAANANVLDAFFGIEDGHGRTAPVGSYAPNPWGLYDMIGNVWEWTATAYQPYPIGSDAPDGDEQPRVDRGGGWDSPPYNARIANRGAGDEGFRAQNLGFRLIAEPR